MINRPRFGSAHEWIESKSKIEYAQRVAKRNKEDHSKVRKISMGPTAHSNMVNHTPDP